MIRECGRLDIKNPYEDITSCEGFSFTKVALDNLVATEAQNNNASGDVDMNDESADPNEERKGDGHTMIDTGGKRPAAHQTGAD